MRDSLRSRGKRILQKNVSQKRKSMPKLGPICENSGKQPNDCEPCIDQARTRCDDSGEFLQKAAFEFKQSVAFDRHLSVS